MFLQFYSFDLGIATGTAMGSLLLCHCDGKELASSLSLPRTASALRLFALIADLEDPDNEKPASGDFFK